MHHYTFGLKAWSFPVLLTYRRTWFHGHVITFVASGVYSCSIFFTMSHLFGSLTPPVVHSKGQNFQLKHFRYQTFNKTRNSWPMTHAGPLKSKNSNFQKNSKFKKTLIWLLLTPVFSNIYTCRSVINGQGKAIFKHMSHDPRNAKNGSEEKNEIESYLMQTSNLDLLRL